MPQGRMHNSKPFGSLAVVERWKCCHFMYSCRDRMTREKYTRAHTYTRTHMPSTGCVQVHISSAFLIVLFHFVCLYLCFRFGFSFVWAAYFGATGRIADPGKPELGTERTISVQRTKINAIHCCPTTT